MTQGRTEGRWASLRRAYPKTMTVALVLLVAFLAADAVLITRWIRYRDETARLRGGMTDAERRRTDMLVASEANRMSVMVELIRRQAASDREIHLSVAVDSGTMLLESDGALLRRMRVEVGDERVVGTPPDTVRIVRPRGARSIERVLGPTTPWEVPAWVFADRAVAAPADRRVQGVLGRNAIVLSGGTVIYARPDSGVLADSAYVMPGSLRVSRADLRAIAPNLSPGVTVYFY